MLLTTKFTLCNSLTSNYLKNYLIEGNRSKVRLPQVYERRPRRTGTCTEREVATSYTLENGDFKTNIPEIS